MIIHNDEERRAFIHAQLIAAKPFLWDGTPEHTRSSRYPDREVRHNLCGAIVEGYKVENNLGRVYTLLYQDVPACRMINKRLGLHRYVPSYLYYAVPQYVEWLTERNRLCQLKERDMGIQAYRLRWLEAMIEEFSK